MTVVLNWLIQGLVVAGAAAAGLRLIPVGRSRARSSFVWAAYLLVLALPAIPLLSGGAIDPQAVGPVPASAGAVLTVPAAWWTAPAVAAALWIVWSAIQAIRLLIGVAAVRRMRRQARPCPGEVLADLRHWSRVNADGRRTRVMLSDDVRFAAVLGCGAPVIALAPGLIAQLSPADLDRVLVHEWAHVQRHDDVAQLAQRVMRVIVGWHPASWWLERRLEFEREAACDEIAVAVTGSAKDYARCLTTLAAIPRVRCRPVPALGALSSSHVRRRLVRVLAWQRTVTAPRGRVATIAAGVGLGVVALSAGHLRAVDSVEAWVPVLPPAPIMRAAAIPARMSAASLPNPAAASRVSSRSSSEVRSEASGTRESDALPHRALTNTWQEPAPAVPSLQSPPAEHPADVLDSAPVAAVTESPISLGPRAPASSTAFRADETARTPWGMAADAGVVIGRSSQTAGVATARFFSRFGKRIASSF